MTVYLSHVEAAEQRLTSLKGDYLRRWGWVQTCQTPGSYWMWRRDFADYDAKYDAWYAQHPDRKRPPATGVMTLPTDVAFDMTRRVLDEQPEIAGEEV